MIRCLSLLLLLLLTLLWNASGAVQADGYKVYGNNLPPFGIPSDVRIGGFSAELIRAAFAEAKTEVPPENYRLRPFARLYKGLQIGPKVVGLHVARNPIREKLFKWVGPYYRIKMGLIGKIDSPVKITNLEEAAKARIGAVANTLPEQLLLKKGIPRSAIHSLNRPEIAIDLLKVDRIDVFAHIFDVSKYLMRQQGVETKLFEEKLTLASGSLYFAFSPDTPDGEISRLQLALNRVMSSPRYAKLCQLYKLDCTDY